MSKTPLEPYEARLIRVPIKDKETKKTTGMAKVGIRVQLPKEEYFFFSLRFGSWTRHLPGLPKTYRTGEPTGEIGPERKSRFSSDRELKTKLGHAKVGKSIYLVDRLIELRDSVGTSD